MSSERRRRAASPKACVFTILNLKINYLDKIRLKVATRHNSNSLDEDLKAVSSRQLTAFLTDFMVEQHAPD